MKRLSVELIPMEIEPELQITPQPGWWSLCAGECAGEAV